MGRIDEALRRAGYTAGATPMGATTDVFVSPWAFREAPAAARPAPPETSLTSFDEPRLGELSGLGRFNPSWLPRLVSGTPLNSALVEQFRALAATLHQAQVDHNVRVLLITSAESSEGKSLTSVNLAITLSESYRRRVLLIDADLRRPSLHQIAQIPNTTGLGDTLTGADEQKLTVYRLSETLTVAPAGQPNANPMRALTSARMQPLLREASTMFDWVLLDAPPLGPIADSSLLAPLCDAALLVVRADRTHYASVEKAIETVGRDRIIGVVLNGGEQAGKATYGDYYTYAESQPRQE